MAPKKHYTVIFHDIRRGLGITPFDYCIVDSIYHLSNSPKNKQAGWFTGSKTYLSDFLGITRKAVHVCLNRLIAKNLLIKQEKTGYLRASELWYELVNAESPEQLENDISAIKDAYSQGVTKVHTQCNQSTHQGVTKVHTRCNQSTHNNNIYNINNNINNSRFAGKGEKTEKKQTKKVDPEKLKKFTSSIEEPKPRKKNPLDGELEGKVFLLYKENIYRATNKTTKTVQEGIPRLIRIFREHFSEDQVFAKIEKAVLDISKADWFRNMVTKNIFPATPKIFLSKKFIEGSIVPTVFKHNSNGKLSKTNTISAQEEAELEAINQQKIRDIMGEDYEELEGV